MEVEGNYPNFKQTWDKEDFFCNLKSQRKPAVD